MVLTGMDRTLAMLEIAEKRLDDRAKLFQANIVSMSIDDRAGLKLKGKDKTSQFFWVSKQ